MASERSWTTVGLPDDSVPTDLNRLYQRLNAEYFDGALPDVPVGRDFPPDPVPDLSSICRWYARLVQDPWFVTRLGTVSGVTE
jgi:hypothetical protein